MVPDQSCTPLLLPAQVKYFGMLKVESTQVSLLLDLVFIVIYCIFTLPHSIPLSGASTQFFILIV